MSAVKSWSTEGEELKPHGLAQPRLEWRGPFRPEPFKADLPGMPCALSPWLARRSRALQTESDRCSRTVCCAAAPQVPSALQAYRTQSVTCEQVCARCIEAISAARHVRGHGMISSRQLLQPASNQLVARTKFRIGVLPRLDRGAVMHRSTVCSREHGQEAENATVAAAGSERIVSSQESEITGMRRFCGSDRDRNSCYGFTDRR